MKPSLTGAWGWVSAAIAIVGFVYSLHPILDAGLFALEPGQIRQEGSATAQLTIPRGAESHHRESVYKVGGNVLPPKLIERREIKWPEDVRRKKWILGMFIAQCVVGSDGHLRNIRVLSGSDVTGIDALGVEALSQFRYEPATLEGRPVAVQMVITYQHWPRRSAD